MPLNKSSLGFTLIELMIVVIIIGILASIAMPAYNNYVTQTRAVAGVSPLADVRVKMEQYFQDNRSYSNGGGCGAVLPANTSTFQYSCVASTSTTYTVTATGIGSMAGFIYTIDQVNTRTTTGLGAGWSAPSLPANCWVTKNGGGC